MAATDFAHLKDLVARVWGNEVLQELEDEDFRRLQDGKYTSKLRLERATAESLIASGLNRAIVDVIIGRTSGASGSGAGAAEQSARINLVEAAATLTAFSGVLQALSIEAAGLEAQSRSTVSSAKRKALGLPADSFKLSLYQYYVNSNATSIPPELRCMVTGFKLPAQLVIAAHLLPRSKPAIAATQWNVGNVNSPRNGVLWAGPIEEAWRKQEVGFKANKQGGFNFTVLTEELLTTRLQQRKREPNDFETYDFKTFGDFDGTPLRVSPSAAPYNRAFLNQFVCAVSYLAKGQRLREGISVDPADYEAASDFENKPDVVKWVARMLPDMQS